MASDATDEFYNVGTGVRTSVRELAELLLELTGSSLEIRYEPEGATFVKNRIGCPRKAREQLGFEAATGLREGLERLIEWRSGHQEAVRRRRRAVGLEA